MVENNQYGWNRDAKSAEHPVGTWTPWPEADAADEIPGPFGDSKYDAYNREYMWFQENQRKYDELLARWKETPDRWFRVSFHGISFNPTACFSVDNVCFQTNFTKEDLKLCYADPKKQKVTNALYGTNQKDIIHGLREFDWDWRVKLNMQDGILVPTELRAMSKSPDRILLDFQHDKKKAVAAAIAATAPNGNYIVKAKQAGWFPMKNGRAGEWLVIQYEILSGQARGYQGALFYDEKQSSDRHQLSIFEQAFGLGKGGLAKLRRRHFRIATDPEIVGLRYYFKAHFSFQDKYIKPENPREVAESEVELWL